MDDKQDDKESPSGDSEGMDTDDEDYVAMIDDIAQNGVARESSPERSFVATPRGDTRGRLKDPPPPNQNNVSMLPKIIQPWQAVIGDRQASSKSTPARAILSKAKIRYRNSRNKSPHQSADQRLAAAMNYYFQELNKAFPDRDVNEPSILIHCSKNAIKSNRVATMNTHKYKNDARATYGVPNQSEALPFYMKSRDPLTPAQTIAKYRREVNRIPPGQTTPGIDFYKDELVHMEATWRKYSSNTNPKERKMLEKALQRGAATLSDLRKDIKPFLDGLGCKRMKRQASQTKDDEDHDSPGGSYRSTSFQSSTHSSSTPSLQHANSRDSCERGRSSPSSSSTYQGSYHASDSSRLSNNECCWNSDDASTESRFTVYSSTDDASESSCGQESCDFAQVSRGLSACQISPPCSTIKISKYYPSYLADSSPSLPLVAESATEGFTQAGFGTDELVLPHFATTVNADNDETSNQTNSSHSLRIPISRARNMFGRHRVKN